MRAPVLAAGLLSLLVAATACSSSDTHPSTGGAGGTGGSGGTGGTPFHYPDPVVNELRHHGDAIPDTAYQAKVVTQFRTPATLPDLDVRSLAVLGTTVYAGTATGLAAWKDGDTAFTAVPVTGTGAVVDLALTGDGRLAVARADGVEVLTAAGGAGTVWPVSGETIAAVATRGTEIWIGTDHGLARLSSTTETPVAAAQGFAVRDLAIAGNVVWMATDAGVRRYDLGADALLADLKAPISIPHDDVRGISVSGDGQQVLAATFMGVARIPVDGSAITQVLTVVGGLPYGDLFSIVDAGGETLTGHGIGATVMSGAPTERYHSKRWIPDQAVTAVALGPDRSRWIGTHQGLTRVSFASQTLADKAALFAPLVEPLWRMEGFVDDDVSYADPWDLTTAPQHSDQDNDGLWTELQIAAWCFAYATTGDEAQYQHARQAMDTMFLLVDVPGESFAARGMKRGFVARSLVRDDEGALYADKAGSDHWVQQAYQGHTYYWKNDTSSDEYAGHFFGMPVFHDLCAKTDAERKEIADRVDLIMGYVVDGGDKLIDLDGLPTSFGRWDDLATAVDGDLGACLAAGKQNCASSYGGGGWLNSIEILGHLLAAWNLTGKTRYYDEYERLAIGERYGDMLPVTDHTFTVVSPHQANHSDHELATLAYYTLLRYEPNQDRRAKWKASVDQFLGYEKRERNALENAMVASAYEDGDLAGAVDTLRVWPVDWRQWPIDNGHRVDAAFDVPDRFDQPQFVVVFPYDEIRTMKWNGNPYAAQGGSAGNAVQGPWPWLLPYWMMRYAGAVVP
jgi:hypothetical protein